MEINEKNLDFISNLDKDVYKHASNICAKYSSKGKFTKEQKEGFPKIVDKYAGYIKSNNEIVGYTNENIEKRVELLNEYYDFIDGNYYDLFSSQSKFRSTILEEFMYILLKDLVEEKKQVLEEKASDVRIGAARSYTNLYFSGKDFEDFISNPKIGINEKDQDFAIYRPINISIGDSDTKSTNLPIIAVENKTYIDKTMLEGSIATADKIKSGNPYSLFMIVSEYYDVDLSIDPIYSRIDQIYILRKSKRKSEDNKPICSDVVISLVEDIKQHLDRDWSDIKNKLEKTGKIM